MKKIVLFTANTMGGIIQFTEQLFRELCNMQYDVMCFIPDATESDWATKANPSIYKYRKINTVNPLNHTLAALVNKIVDEVPYLVWFTDSAILTYEISILLKKRGIRCMVTFHDAAGFHPTNKKSLKKWLHNSVLNAYARISIKKTDVLLTLSKESKKTMEGRYPSASSKICMMNLGAHIPNVFPRCPQELNDENVNEFLLFFGRIDKYKGLKTLFEAYIMGEEKMPSFVVAGSGTMSEEEQKLANKTNGIIINRFITDSEMLWLFQHSVALILPYIEATQSGIIPIAYHYGKPVIVSNVEGLTQFVEHGKTGYICRYIDEYVRAICSICDDKNWNIMVECCLKYHEKNFNWEKNIKELFLILCKVWRKSNE